MSKLNLVGHVFTRLTVVREVGRGAQNRVMWECRCSCGGERVTCTATLRRGEAKSCGCLRRENMVALGRSRRTHGSDHPLLHLFHGMHARCKNKRHKAYPSYGGRGIRVCERWSSFENFLADMGERPPGTMIERMDNDGPYSPDNCRWATRVEQMNNKTDNTWLTLPDGRRLTMAQASREFGLSSGVLHLRMKKTSDVTEILRPFGTRLRTWRRQAA